MSRLNPSALGAIVLVSLASSCAGRIHHKRTSAAQLVPIGGQRFLSFQDAQVQEFDGATAVRTQLLGREAPGRACISAVDRPTGRACVAYERALAVVNPEDVDWEWHDAPWSSAPSELAYVDGRVIAIERNRAHVFDLSLGGPPRSLDLTPILRQIGRPNLCFVLPVKDRPDELLVVSAKYPKVGIARVSTAKGECSLINAGVSIDMHLNYVQRCTTDGKNLYLAGAYESIDRSTGFERLKQELTVLRVDPTTSDAVTLLADDITSNEIAECNVLDLVAGGDLVVALVARKDGSEQVRAYKVVESGGGATALSWQKRVAPGSALAWLNPPRFAVFESGALQIAP
ncbi:MAG: hypothetical protein IT454_02020 [Planctomycetes bacterium]|nr:hypothetical protein [Planctomycetota bacterium]